MQQNIDACWSFTSAAEGGYSSIRSDPGNWSLGTVGSGRLIGSMWGISAPMLISWVGPAAGSMLTASDMQALPEATARAIFTTRFWNALSASLLPSGVDVMVVDYGFNAGDGASAMLLQGAVGVSQDGAIGPITLAAIAAVDPSSLINRLSVAQQDRYEKSANFSLYGAGWTARTVARAALARRLCSGIPATMPPPAARAPQPRPVLLTAHPNRNGGHL